MVAKLKHRVLLVDDDERVLRFARLKLMASGFDVLTAMTGQGALAMIESGEPDIVILDMRMPGMSGLDVLRELRSHSDMPVIIISAAELPAEAITLRANAYIPKPFDPDELLREIQTILHRDQR